MTSRQHSHPKHIRWFKNIIVILAFVYPVYFFLKSIYGINPNSLTEISVNIIIAFFMMVTFLVGPYYFGQDVLVDEEGLQIEFLWKKMRVQWTDIIETKTTFGSWFAPEKNRPLIILVNGLTPFHRIFGVLYGLSIKPGFVIFPSISDFEILINEIKKNIPKNKRR